MATSLVSGLINAVIGLNSKFSVTDEASGLAVWTEIKILNVEIDSSSLQTSNPVASEKASENSTLTSLISTDINTIKIIQPAQMRITAFAASLSGIESVVNSFFDTKATLKVTTKGITAIGMAVSDIEVDQTPEMTSAVKLIIDLTQSYLPSPTSGFNPAQSANYSVASSYGVSTQAGLPATVSSIYNKISNFIKG